MRGLGGVVTRTRLLRFVTRHNLERAVADGRVVALGRGRFGLPDLDEAVAAATRLSGVLCLTSAALYLGWSVAFAPPRPHVLVPRNRSVAPSRRGGVMVHRWDAAVVGIATAPEQTVLDCATHLPLLEAVCVGDSAIHSGACSALSLTRAAESSPRSGRARRVSVVEQLDGRSTNAFESATRVLASTVSGLDLVPQLHLPGYGFPDLRDGRLRLIVECDSYAFHSARPALTRDIERYNNAALLDHTVLRFAYEHPFFQPEYVVRVFTSWLAARRDTVACPRPCCTARTQTNPSHGR